MRIGILGAARIAPAAVIKPAANVGGVTVASVAARDAERAAGFAAKHSIGRTHPTYEALVEDPEIDAVYNPLPNSLHAEWTERALRAGKHVLCEKPFTSNTAEAAHVASVADETGNVVVEAFHYRYHPLAARMLEIVESGELGTVEHVETWMCFPLPRFSDIRYRYDLGGGALMDAGCYAVHLARLLGREEPTVVSAAAKLHKPRVDRAMSAELRFPSGHTGHVKCSMWSSSLLSLGAKVTGSDGEMRVLNPYSPQNFHRLTVNVGGSSRTEQSTKRPTYEFQLEAFRDTVLDGTPSLTPPSTAIANMTVIDAIYQAAALPVRGT